MEAPKKDIIILGSGKFDGEYQSTIFSLAKEFAQGYRVFYFDYPFTITDCIKFRNTDQYRLRKPHFSFQADGVIQTSQPNLNVIISPPLLSIHFLPEGFLYRQLLKINELIISRRMRKIIKKFKIGPFIYINSFNFHYPGIADRINPHFSIYHSVDPLIIPYDLKHGVVSERILVKKSDAVVCTSKQLYLEQKRINENTLFIPNAADIQHSRKAMNSETPVFEALKDISQPIIGYIGNIERRIDFDLLKKVIDQNRDKCFVFVGPLAPEFIPQWFTEDPNVRLAGKVPYNQLPSVLKTFDVAIIPFKKDEVSATIFPLKLFEYLGAGKPVVATKFNTDLADWTEDAVRYCDNAEAFSKGLAEALEEGNNGIEYRVAVAQNNTWKKRAEAFEMLFNY